MLNLTEIVRVAQLGNSYRLRLVAANSLACVLVVAMGDGFEAADKVFHVDLLTTGVRFEEDILIDIAEPELFENLTQIGKFDEFFFLTSTSDLTAGIEPRSENFFISN